MATYTKSIQPGRNIYIITDGEDTRTLTMQDYGGYLHCDQSDAPFTGETESSSQEEYESAQEEAFISWGRIGSRPSSAP